VKFTLFTPVFNRAAVIERVWRSIQNQAFRDFEWVCVDDGSEDGSLRKLESYQANANFPVLIIKHERNSGKHIAWNHAVAVAKGELFVPCDSDDEFDSDTLEFFSRQWDGLTNVERNRASGINVLCRHAESRELVGSLFPHSPMWSNNLELFYRFRVTGEKWGCIRTDVLKKWEFPLTQGCFGESYVWYSIARQYQALCFNKILRTYYSDQGNKLSAKVPRVERLPAMYDYACWHIRENWDYIKMQPVRLVGEGSNVFLRAFLLDRGLAEPRVRLQGTRAGLFWPLFAMVGWLRFLKMKSPERNKSATRLDPTE